MGYVSYVAKPKNKRVSARKDVNKEAWIVLSGGFAVRPCKVLDVSETGVRLSAENAHTIPGIFTLRMTRNNGASGRTVRVKWRHGSEIGAVFV
jgi:hypothetical protein